MRNPRTTAGVVATTVLFSVALGICSAQVANSNTTRPAAALYAQAMKAMQKSEYSAARADLEKLINAYPDSDYIPRAKLSVADAWYAEGDFRRAEMEYQDIITFFPNRPEVPRAQLKIDSIHKTAKN